MGKVMVKHKEEPPNNWSLYANVTVESVSARSHRTDCVHRNPHHVTWA
jgi:hypothetical protein